MTETKNFFLQLFEGIDKFDYKVINENWQKIDDALNALLNGGDSVALPTITVEKIMGGYRITTSDVKGSKSFNLINGKSAYDYAKENGFAGTEAEYAAWCSQRVMSIEQTASSTESGGENIWTFTLNDGTQTDLVVRNGKGSYGASAEIVDGVLVVKNDLSDALDIIHDYAQSLVGGDA